MEYQIRWKKGDYISLGKAVAKFNRKVRELERQDIELNSLNEIDYKEAKSEITTRKQLQHYINSLKRFNGQDATQIIMLPSGEMITKWQYEELSRNEKTVIRRLNKDLSNIDRTSKPYQTSEERTILANKKAVSNWRNLSGQKFLNMVNRLQFFGSADVKMRKAIVYRENYINQMEKYQNFQSYDKLMKKLNSIKNPIAFYETIKEHELYDDLFVISNQWFTQMQFNRLVEAWGVELEAYSDSVAEFWERN